MSTTPPETTTVVDPRRWLALVVIAVAQLMVVLDASIVNIALPSAQHALGITDANRQWVVTAYALAFGGLLLLGGRVADFIGRKRAFIIGLVGFGVASAIGGLAQNQGELFGARALQGAFAALMAPAALSLITVTFSEPKERAKAFGVYGGISGGGAALGLILGGVLTEYASWRWTLLVNTPIAIATAVAAYVLVRESRAEGEPKYDIPGVVTSTLGLVALVYGFTKANESGWSATSTISLLAAAVVLLVAFVVIERNTSEPLLPPRVFTERNRAGAFLVSLLLGLALFGMFLFLVYYMQGTLHYSAVKSGLAFLPFSVGVVAGAGVASSLLPRIGPRPLMVGGTAAAAIGMALFAQITVDGSYLSTVLPAQIVVSVGMGLAFVALSSTALVGVEDHDAGVASALVNTTQQVGGSLGTALLNTIAATATANYISANGAGQVAEGLVHGYTVAFTWSLGALILATILSLALVTKQRPQSEIEGAETAFEHAEELLLI
ncbi:DHA2 family efflux MFS transporter permease subunit [Nocardioides marmoriginsengisoli]|uniref:DHA2 family efflux MFS transporter permease subunit n=1 Tax=Nocardioides marmoriginsengisoli TaxID=661483 RepID=A0A3N0CH30_9ACTN|nr:MFS transporter [Nocardioides marmoriginsengisoli]RNL62750.1 DHA2 family efflux MFS transporter permease subunit [Nocardioides marmoriginsengisoli]